MLPLKFCWKTMPRPTSVRISLEEAQVTDWCLAQVVERAEAVHRVDAPARVGRVVALPVERRLPTFRTHRRPPLGQPQLRSVVAVLLDELQVLRASDKARREPVGSEVNIVARRLIIKRKGIGRSRIGRKADLGQTR